MPELTPIAAVLAAGFVVCFAAPAMAACRCTDMPDPSALRSSAAIILEGEVSMVEPLSGALADQQRATIRVMRVMRSNGHLAGFVRVDSALDQTCGYAFRTGETREFLVRRVGGRFVTDRCLMYGAREPGMPDPKLDVPRR